MTANYGDDSLMTTGMTGWGDDGDDGNNGDETDDVPDDDPEEFNAGVDEVLFGSPQISDSVLLTKLSLGLSGLQNCFTCSGVSPCEF